MSILVCPDCKGRFSLEILRRVGGEVEQGTLTCEGCRQSFPITRYIPRFVSSDKYVGNFSAQWSIFSRTQLDSLGKSESRDTFLAKTGRRPEDLAGKLVLDAGCGMGRFSDVVSREDTATAVGFDLSLAVEAAWGNIGRRENVHIVQADIFKLPFAEGVFDFIYSIGVLHHTPDPERAFESLVPLLKQDGEVAVWVYSKSKSDFYSDIYRKITCRMPWSMLLGLSKVLVSLYGLYVRFPYPRKFLPISMHGESEWRLLDTFDWYGPRYQYKFKTDEVLAWFTKMGLREIQPLTVPVSVRAKKRREPTKVEAS